MATELNPDNGQFLGHTVVTEADGRFIFEIDSQTKVLKEDGTIPEKIEILIVDEPPQPPTDFEIIGKAYEFSPSGITLNPPPRLTLKYDPRKLPQHTEYVALASYTQERGWEEIDAEMKEGIGRITSMTTRVSHFTIFAVLAKVSSPLPASFKVSSLGINPSQVATGEIVTILAELINSGGAEGSYSVVLKINGVKVSERSVIVAPKTSKQVIFSVTGKEIGTYTVTVDGLSGSFTVAAPPLPTTSTPTLTPQPTPQPTAPPAKPQTNWLFIGGIIAAAVAGGLLLFFLVRQIVTSRRSAK